MVERIESLRRAKPSLRSLVALIVSLSLVVLPAAPATMAAPVIRVLAGQVSTSPLFSARQYISYFGWADAEEGYV